MSVTPSSIFPSSRHASGHTTKSARIFLSLFSFSSCFNNTDPQPPTASDSPLPPVLSSPLPLIKQQQQQPKPDHS
eukprot:g12073.t1